ncbi:phosphoenolpyruvate carboxykinase [GTP]-like [Pomacea canaliculata]|uniref:phosphoenolpyruvate carboxykinase [GTP]-like n=1 Tax=Pomacea canaliculata TaxID=400727 RepID=UPI000D73337C|nr:phosphoenolpyruvate carboxykinase [GTP]-like [Pomacea canaliculata]XP_025076320.1 phosphoenolpyruvate carboxykinase [GTP]-like [Pomacea canaliculata]
MADKRKYRMYPDIKEEDLFNEVHEIVIQKVGHVQIVKGNFKDMTKNARIFVCHCIQLMNPRCVYICDGSEEEAHEITNKLLERGVLTKLKYPNSYLCRTDPSDVARVESKTYIVTADKYEAVPHTKPGVEPILGHWMSPDDMQKELDERFRGCMAGRTMFVIPFSMGPVGSPLSKVGIQVTDSNYVLLCMRIMTRVTPKVWDVLKSQEEDDFVKCIHSVGLPRPVQRPVKNHWPCNPEKVMIVHFPDERKIKSFGSGYGGNSLLGKKCFALRIASVIARDEGWMAEHMLISGITPPDGEEMFIAAAFPSACGKTNLAMITPGLPGFKVQCVGDDIAWMRFNKKGELRGINPEAGFFGVAPGTNWKTNPNAMKSFQANSIFTNVAMTADGGYYWEGLEDEYPPGTAITTWLGTPSAVGWSDTQAAHPNSRFTCPASQCPIIHPKWEDPEGVPISAIIFGGRRPKGVPLVYEAFNWEHGVMIGACVKSEATAAAEFKGKTIMHDPMAMRPFMGYNFGQYLQHWLDIGKVPGRKLPKIFHVNWFRTNDQGKFLWPGFGENIRVLDWILRRCKGDDSIAVKSPIGYIPKPGTINMKGLSNIDEKELFSLPKSYWMDDTRESRRFLEDQVGCDTPPIIFKLLDEQEAAFAAWPDD